jgi:DNA-binding NarL/FixJ family response regulator
VSLWCDRKPTRRERDVAELVARGMTNKQIARELGIDEDTVKTHIYRLCRKLAVPSRVGVALWYAREADGREAKRLPPGPWGVSV